MTRDEFMKHAKDEIDQAFSGQRNRMMNLVEQAWAEGKKNAEMAHIDEIGTDILENLKKKMEEPLFPHMVIDAPKITLPYTPPSIGSDKISSWCENDIPSGCRNCPNHPINGGSGICHCIIGTPQIMCNSTATDICTAIEKDKMSDLAMTVATAVGNVHDLEVYNAACDNHIKIVHDMMTGVKPIDGQE